MNMFETMTHALYQFRITDFVNHIAFSVFALVSQQKNVNIKAFQKWTKENEQTAILEAIRTIIREQIKELPNPPTPRTQPTLEEQKQDIKAVTDFLEANRQTLTDQSFEAFKETELYKQLIDESQKQNRTDTIKYVGAFSIVLGVGVWLTFRKK